MKKFVLLIIIFITIQNCCFANKMKAVSLNEFTTTNPNADIKVYVYEDFYIHSQLFLPHGSVLVGKIANITQPKRGNVNASFQFIPLYYMNAEKKKYKINMPLCAKYKKASDLDSDGLAESAKFGIIYKLIPGSKTIRNAFNGTRQRTGGQVSGAAKNIYKHSFLAKGEMGSHLRIKKYDCFYLDFDSVDKKTYTFDALFTQIDNYGNPLTITAEKKVNNVPGSDLEVNYPYEHQLYDKIYYLSKPKDFTKTNKIETKKTKKAKKTNQTSYLD